MPRRTDPLVPRPDRRVRVALLCLGLALSVEAQVQAQAPVDACFRAHGSQTGPELDSRKCRFSVADRKETAVRAVGGVKLPYTLTCGRRDTNQLLRVTTSAGNEVMAVCLDIVRNRSRWVAHAVYPASVRRAFDRPNVSPWFHYTDPSGARLGNGRTIPGFDRGHLAPAGDFARYEVEQYASHFVGNRAAQASALNRNQWKCLEGTLRTYVRLMKEEFVVVTGVAVGGGANTTDPTSEIELEEPDYFLEGARPPRLRGCRADLGRERRCRRSPVGGRSPCFGGQGGTA